MTEINMRHLRVTETYQCNLGLPKFYSAVRVIGVYQLNSKAIVTDIEGGGPPSVHVLVE